MPTETPDTDRVNSDRAVAALRSPGNWIFLQVLGIYLLFVVTAYTVAAAASLGVPGFVMTSILGWIIVGWGQFALFNALHEGLHRRFGNPHRERLGFLIAAYTVGFTHSYRHLHLDHHRYFGDCDRDPDYVNYADFPASRPLFIKRLAWNLSGLAAALQFAGLRQAGRQHEHGRSRSEWFGLLLVQVVIFGAFSVTIGPLYYLWLWLFPLATTAKFFAFLRTFCEHGDPAGRNTIRTITGPALDTRILGVFCFRYHAEHHKHVHVPCRQLAEAHVLMKEKLYKANDTKDVQYVHWDMGYGRLLWSWYRALPPTAAAT